MAAAPPTAPARPAGSIRMPAPPSGPSPTDTPTIKTDSPFEKDTTDRTGEARKSFEDKLSKKMTPMAEPPPPKGDRTPPEMPPSEGEGEEAEAVGDQKAPVAAKPGEQKKPERKNPWKLYDDEKKRTATLESENQKLRSERLPEQDRSAMTDRLTKAEARVKELENEMEYVNFQKSPKYTKEYEEPFVQAWNDAVKELSEITVNDAGANGGVRAATAEDIWTLVNLPLGQAQDVAEELFGKFSGTAMQHRKTVKDLLTKRDRALQDAQKNSGERSRQQQEAMVAATKSAAQEIGKFYQEALNDLLADPESSEFLTPHKAEEGKELSEEHKEWNTFLERGYKLVDEGWSKSPLEPGISQEEKKLRIRKHLAIRHRSAAFGPLKRAHKRALKLLAERDKTLNGYKDTAPAASGRNGSGPVGGQSNARDAFKEKLESFNGR